jgi:hypothetical protein
MLNDPSYGPADKLVGELAEAYLKTIFAPDFFASGRPVVGHQLVLAQLLAALAPAALRRCDTAPWAAHAATHAAHQPLQVLSRSQDPPMPSLPLPSCPAIRASPCGPCSSACSDLTQLPSN